MRTGPSTDTTAPSTRSPGLTRTGPVIEARLSSALGPAANAGEVPTSRHAGRDEQQDHPRAGLHRRIRRPPHRSVFAHRAEVPTERQAPLRAGRPRGRTLGRSARIGPRLGGSQMPEPAASHQVAADPRSARRHHRSTRALEKLPRRPHLRRRARRRRRGREDAPPIPIEGRSGQPRPPDRVRGGKRN